MNKTIMGFGIFCFLVPILSWAGLGVSTAEVKEKISWTEFNLSYEQIDPSLDSGFDYKEGTKGSHENPEITLILAGDPEDLEYMFLEIGEFEEELNKRMILFLFLFLYVAVEFELDVASIFSEVFQDDEPSKFFDLGDRVVEVRSSAEPQLVQLIVATTEGSED